jgi:hypothetical protein
MGEIETTEQEEDTTVKTGEEDTDTSENNDGADDGDQDGSDADDNKDDAEGDDQEAGKDKSKSDTSKDDEQEPPTRKRPIDFIKERQERKKAPKETDKSKGADDEDAEDDIDPEDEKTIGKVVSKRLKEALEPFAQAQAQQQDDAEIADFLKANPDFKAYEAKARKYMAHPSRKDVPIEEIFYGVAGRDLLKIGAKRSKIADDEAKKSKSAAGSQDAGAAKGNATLTREQLEAKQAEVRSKMADRY